VPEIIRTHLLAHELTHLELETEARAKGRNRFFASTRQTEDAAAALFHGDLRKTKKRGYSDDSLRSLSSLWVRGVSGFLFNCPLDMVIESRLWHRIPALRPAQFISTRKSVDEAYRTNTNTEVREITPGLILRASLALNAAFCLFLDDLYQGATAYAGLYQGEESFALAQRLFRRWRERASQLEPGDEYDLVDDFADMLGLSGWYVWQPDPGEHQATGAARKEGITDPELLKLKQPASFFFLLDALKRFDELPVEEVQKIVFEIGVIGQNGLDYALPDEKYTLTTLPDEKFSGLHLMCLMFAGFKQIAPGHDVGMDLEEPFLKALEAFQVGGA